MLFNRLLCLVFRPFFLEWVAEPILSVDSASLRIVSFILTVGA